MTCSHEHVEAAAVASCCCCCNNFGTSIAGDKVLLGKIFLVLTVLVNTCEQTPSGVKEYCLTEKFRATCEEDEVIIMNLARFGRMRLGRCVTANFGNLGCSEDVLTKMDSRCSGRHSCDLDVSDAALVRTEPCPQDFASYLEAEFTCIKVPSTDKVKCRASTTARLPLPNGFVASITTEETGCGSSATPWVIDAQPGQRINVTMFDFGIDVHNDSAGNGAGSDGRHRPPRPLFCQQYAVLEEPVTSRSTTVCQGNHRVRNVYVSQTHRLHVSVINRKMMGHPKHFMLHYQVVDCPHLVLPPRSHMRREGPKVTVVCNATGDTSILKCEGTEWRGEIKNCSETVGAGTAREREDAAGVGLPPLGVSVVIIVGVALVVVVYVAIMIICVMFMQRRRRRRAQAELASKCQEISPVDLQMTKPCGHGSEERVPMLGKSQIGLHLHSAGGDYPDMRELAAARAALVQEGTVTILDTSPPPPGAENLPLPRCDCTAGTLPKNQGHYGVLGHPRAERTYESPNRKRAACQKYVRMTDGGVPCYYDLSEAQAGGAPGDTLPEPDVVTVTLYPMNHRHSNPAGTSGGYSSSSNNNGAAAERDNSANRMKEQAL